MERQERKYLASKEEITSLIPHREPFVMIDILLEQAGAKTVTELEITQGNLLVQEGIFTEAGLVENMAQTAAAGAGWMCRKMGTNLPVSFLGAVSDLEILSAVHAGDTIETHTEIKQHALNITLIEASVYRSGELVARGGMKIVSAEAKE